jgi:hypothetical protein
MKQRLTSYTFDASAKTVLAGQFSDVGLAGIQLIVNVTDQVIIYNFADSAKGGTLSTDTLTLEYDTTTMDDADELMILVEDGVQTVAVTSATLATAAKQDTIIGHVDGIETLIGTTNSTLTTIDGRVDGIEALIGTTNSSLTTIDGRVDGIEGLLTTISGNVDGLETSNSAIQTAVQLIDDTVQVLGTDTYTEATSKGITLGAVRRDADTTLVNTTNEFTPLQVDANGRLKVEAFSGETLPVSFTGSTDVATQTTLASLLTSSQLIDDAIYTDDTSTHATGTSKGYGVMAVANPTDAAVDANDIGMVAMTLARALKNDITTIAGTAPTTAGFIDIKGADGNVFVRQATASNLNMTEASAASALTSLQLIDDAIFVDDTATHATGTTKGMGIMAVAAPTDAAVNANDIGMPGMTVNRELYVSLITALPAGTAAIGKLAANSGVDIGDVTLTANDGVDIGNVDVTSIVPLTGATNLGKAEDAGHTTGDTGVYSLGVRNDTPNTATTNTDADYSSLSTDRVGGIRTALYETDFAVLGTNHVKKYYTSAGAATDGIVWSPAAGKRWYVTDIFINVSAAATVTLEDDLVAGDAAVWKAELAANSGWSHHFGTPLFSGEDAADLLVTTTAGNVYITVTGYEI